MVKRPVPNRAGPTVRPTVRMYRVGFGDCFLLTLPRPAGQPFRMLIDCGVAQHTPNEAALMNEVVSDIIRECGGVIDVLAVTHEHYDHVSGLVTAADLFLRANEPDDPARLRVRETWFAWTEDENDPLARRLQQTRGRMVDQLSKLAFHLSGDASTAQVASQIDGLMGFFGASGGGPGRTKAGMDNARAFGQAVRYHQPGQLPLQRDDMPGVRIWVLGPPKDDAALRVENDVKVTYRIAALAETGQMLFQAAALNGIASLDTSADEFSPFDAAAGMALTGSPVRPGAPALRPVAPDVAKFLHERYDGPDRGLLRDDQSWRRIENDWLGAAADLALHLDHGINNTSLVLAVELTPGGPVLLFAADAQVGNWQSWQDVQWTLPGGETMRGPDLLRRAAFYKVGHHGSQNATMKAAGLDLMPHGVTAFIPVDHDIAVGNSWGDKFPLPSLEAALDAITGGRVVRNDRPYPAALGGAAAAKAFRPRKTPVKDAAADPGKLYYEWSIKTATA